jgi:hypothetical protein
MDEEPGVMSQANMRFRLREAAVSRTWEGREQRKPALDGTSWHELTYPFSLPEQAKIRRRRARAGLPRAYERAATVKFCGSS